MKSFCLNGGKHWLYGANDSFTFIMMSIVICLLVEKFLYKVGTDFSLLYCIMAYNIDEMSSMYVSIKVFTIEKIE